MRLRLSFLPFHLVLLFAMAAPQPSAAAGCTSDPEIRFKKIEIDRIVVEFNENCTGESWSKVWAQAPNSGWARIRTDFGDLSGWREAVDDGLKPNSQRCYEAESFKDGIIRISNRICATTPPQSLKLGLITPQLTDCGALPSPSATDRLEHVYVSEALADLLRIDKDAVREQDPSPQVRIVIDSPLLPDGRRSTATYTVARVCTKAGPYDWNLWMWNDDKLYPTSAPSLGTLTATIHTVAPGTTRWEENGVDEPASIHFHEPNSGSSFFRENVSSVGDKRVVLLIPHGGGIERNTSAQIQDFVDELAPIGVNVWESEGQWPGGGARDRWHITAGDIHRNGFPGLDRLLNEPQFEPGRSFEYAVAFHGYSHSTDSTGAIRKDMGIILGGRADRDVLCHVARAIQTEAGTRSSEIGFHIANARANGQDLRIPNVRNYAPSPSNLQGLEGTSEDNIVNRLAHADGSAVWGGIQLEQSLCLRRQMDCDLDGDDVNEACREPDCMHEVVARGVAQAIAGLVDSANPVDPAGACCTHYNECP